MHFYTASRRIAKYTPTGVESENHEDASDGINIVTRAGSHGAAAARSLISRAGSRLL